MMNTAGGVPPRGPVLKLSMVSLPKISDISLRVVFSLPPKKSVVSQLPTMVSLAGKGSGTPPFCNGVCHAPGAYPATVTAWQTAGGQGKLHFPYAALRQLPLCELAGSEHLATQAIHFPQV